MRASALKRERHLCVHISYDYKKLRVGLIIRPPERTAVNPPADAVHILPVRSAILFPASLMPKKDIVVSSRQTLRTPFWPDLEGEAMTFENFLWCAGWAIGPPLICRSWVSEASAIPPPANPWNWLLAMPVELDDSSFRAFSPVDKGIVTIEPQTLDSLVWFANRLFQNK
jgi:hypothetical protein